MEQGQIVVHRPAQFPEFKPGQVWQGAEGDAMWVAYKAGEIVFYTTRGTRVNRIEAEHVYAPMTLVFPGV